MQSSTGEALFRCARPSGVPRGPATSTGSLASQRHPGTFPKVPGRRRGQAVQGGSPDTRRQPPLHGQSPSRFAPQTSGSNSVCFLQFCESTLRMRWPKYWSFSFSIIPSKEIPGLISFRMDWLALLALGLALGSPIFPSGCEGKLGVALESLQGN